MPGSSDDDIQQDCKLVNDHPVFTRAELTKIVFTYKTRSVFRAVGIRSQSMRNLFKMITLGRQSDEITREDIEKALKHSSHRLRLFQGKDVPDLLASTDEVVALLAERFGNTPQKK